MNTEIKLSVTEIQRFCMHDGPGIRTTVFLKGCPLRCAWCHNPETQKSNAELLFYQNKCIRCSGCAAFCPTGVHTIEGRHHTVNRNNCILCSACANSCPTGALDICGKELSIEDILAVAEKDRAFYGDVGGITLSGGEPLAQGEYTVELLKACKESGLNTAIETCGYADTKILRAAAPFSDLFLWDIKDTNDARHKQYTGVSNRSIIENLCAANEMNTRIRLRCILVNGVNTERTHYSSLAALAHELNNFDGIELIPYHAYGGAKAVFLGLESNEKKEWIPTEDQISQARNFLENLGVRVV